MAATTSPLQAGRARRGRTGPDRVTLVLLSLTGFLVALALLATQLRAAPFPSRPAHRILEIRRVYRTRIVDDQAGAASGPSVTQSQSVSGSAPAVAAAPTTHTS